jgi:tRNA(adenine34) deaminase
MCAGAIINARIKTVVFGAFDAKMGSLDSKINLAASFDFKPEIYAGICEKECTEILKDFFKDMRND